MRRKRSHALVCEELEPRLLLSADLAAIAVGLTPNDAGLQDGEADLQAIADGLRTESQSQADESGLTPRELVVIDPTVPDYQSLVDDIIGQLEDDRSYEIVILDSGGNGIDQLSETLAEYQGLAAIHLISHGSDGGIHLAGDVIDSSRLQSDSATFSAWGSSLSADGDILIYGCDLAATHEGEAFIDALAEVTGADIAASDDATGDVSLGGDWWLEYQVGTINTAVAFTTSLQDSWGATLDITTGLVGHYSFDEGSGTAAIDSSATGNDGTLVGSPAYVAGQVGNSALSFNGDFDRVEVADNAATNFGTGDFTVAFWFNSTHAGGTGRLVGDMDGGDGYVIYTNGIGDLVFQVASGLDTVVLGAGGLFDGGWHHVVATVSGADWMLYVDNTLVDSINNPFIGNIDNVNTLRIGASSDVHNEYDGLIDEVRLYDRAFTSADVTELFLDANDAPVLDSASLTLNEGQTVSLSGANFGITDPDDSSFTYTVSGVTGGIFQLSSNSGVSIANFSSAELAANSVQFVDDGNEVAPSFSVTVNDGNADSNALAASITYTAVNDAPVINSANLTVTEGQTVTLTGADFDITDPDDSSFFYTVSAVNGGYFQLSSNPGVSIATFSSADLVGNLVEFVDDGNEVAPAFNVTVNDGEADSNTLAASITYTAANDAPVIDSAGMALSEGQTVTLGGADFGISDPDDSTFTYIVSGVTGGHFQLSTNPSVSISSFSSANLTGGLVQFVDNGDETAPAFNVTVNDGGSDSNTLAASITYTPANDAPVVDLNGPDGAGVDFAVSFTEGAGAVNVVDADATVSDVDSVTYENLSINLSGFLDSGSEQIVIAGYTFTYGSADVVTRTVGSTSFVIDFDGSGFNVMLDGLGWMPQADLQALLRGVTYENTSLNPTSGDRTINIFAQDSSLLVGSIATSTISVIALNDAPTATNNSNTVSENGFVSGNVITDDSGFGVDSDPEGDQLQVTQVDGGSYTPGLPVILASGAQVTFQSTGNYTYNTSGQFIGLGAGNSVEDSFTYQISDGNGGFDAATVTVTINGSNDAPSIANANLSLSEGQTVTLSSANFTINDPDDTVFIYTVSGVAGGYFQLNTNHGVSISNFSSAQLGSNEVQFVDNGDETAPAFSVTVNDGVANSNTLAASVTYTAANDEPVLDSASLTVSEGQIVTLSGANFGITDPDDTAFAYTVSGVTGGYFQLSGTPGVPITTFTSANLANGLVQFVDNGDETAPAFSLTVNDGSSDSNTLAAAVSFTLVSDSTPLATIDSITVTEGGTVSVLVDGAASVLSNDVGLSDTPVTVSLVSGVSYGSLALNADGTFTYTHDGSENHADSFVYGITDNDGQTSEATVNIKVVPVSDTIPLASIDVISLAEGGTATTLVGGAASVLDNDAGLSDTPVTVSLVTDVTNGSLTLNTDGTFSYTHNGSENHSDSFTYGVTDNDGQFTEAVVTISVSAINEAPVVTSYSGLSDVSLTLSESEVNVATVSAFDPDFDSMIYALDGGVDLGVFSIHATSGELVFSQAPDAENPGDADLDNVYEVEVLISDGNGGTVRQAFTVEVTDIDEFDVGLLMDLDSSPDMINPYGSIDDQVGITVWGEDPDDSRNIVSYSLDDDAGGVFAIDPVTGVITLASSVSESDLTKFEITVRATGEDGSYSVRTFSVGLSGLVFPEGASDDVSLDEVILEFDSADESEIEESVVRLNDELSDVTNLPESELSLDNDEQDNLLVDVAVENGPIGSQDGGRDWISVFHSASNDRDTRGVESHGSLVMQDQVSESEHPLFNMISEEPIEVADSLWSLLEVMNREMSDDHSEHSEGSGLVVHSATFGTLALSAGYVAWLLRAGVLSASLLSSLPLWRQVDPLPILSARAKRRETERVDARQCDEQERQMETIFNRSQKSRRDRPDNSGAVS